MDPKACLKRIRNAQYYRDWQEAEDAIEDLLSWVDRGGFLPDGYTRALIANMRAHNREMAYADESLSRAKLYAALGNDEP
jgi:hypothetical protein